jgi:hypothetical protein
VGGELGYEVDELAMTGARVAAAPDTVGPSSWGPVLVARGPWGLRVGDDRTGRPGFSEKDESQTTSRVVDQGTWGIALLTRVPLESRATLDLGQLRRDPARRGAISVELAIKGRILRIIGTHLSHLSHGSVLQLRALERMISVPDSPAVLMGDMNMWGPPLSALPRMAAGGPGPELAGLATAGPARPHPRLPRGDDPRPWSGPPRPGLGPSPGPGPGHPRLKVSPSKRAQRSIQRFSSQCRVPVQADPSQ